MKYGRLSKNQIEDMHTKEFVVKVGAISLRVLNSFGKYLVIPKMLSDPENACLREESLREGSYKMSR